MTSDQKFSFAAIAVAGVAVCFCLWSLFEGSKAMVLADYHSELAEEALDSTVAMRGRLEAAVTADSLRQVAVGDSIAVYAQRAIEADERIASARRDGQRVVDALRMTLDSVQLAQQDTIEGMHTAEVESLTMKLVDMTAERDDWKSQHEEAQRLLFGAREIIDEMETAAVAFQLSNDLKDAVVRRALIEKRVYQGVAVLGVTISVAQMIGLVGK